MLESEKAKSAIFERVKIDLENKEQTFINNKKENAVLAE
jgi:hypothetical protein